MCIPSRGLLIDNSQKQRPKHCGEDSTKFVPKIGPVVPRGGLYKIEQVVPMIVYSSLADNNSKENKAV